MIRINDILDRMAAINPEADLDVVERAYVFSARAHEGQLRLSGEPYLSHPLEVAYILADMNLDPESVAAGLLHDVIEDTKSTPEEIQRIFGPQVLHIVLGVTKLSKLSFSSALARQAESIRRMLLAMADDIRVILIKLADRLHNMRTLQYQKTAKRRKIAQETRDIYAPIAARLGIFWMKKELEDTAFMYLQAEDYARIEAMINTDRIKREEYVETIKNYVTNKMVDANLTCEVLGRYKNIYSIYNKMVSQNLAFEDVYDIIAFRIVLDTVPQCYEALGLIHSLWKPIDIKFKDYIARPKPNMYQSLHTTVIGPLGERIEIQIRTHEMDRVAKSGIAAHWQYKEGRSFDPSGARSFAWIQNLIENQENIRDPIEFMENVRIDLYPDEVHVFTPKGEIRTLPKGATPVDFAYMIHSEVGHQCTGAKVNGRMVPLKYELQTGDVVEVITTKNHQPSKDWLKFVKSVKARSKIRQWIKTQEKDRSVALGREMCEKAFRKHRQDFSVVLKDGKLAEAIEFFGFKTLDDLLASVGYGKVTPLQVLRRFSPREDAEPSDEALLNKYVARQGRRKKKTGVLVKGVDDILIRFGKCCQPLPGDPIVGYITMGFGVTVHRSGCVNALKMNPERSIDVSWQDGIAETYPVRIRINSMDRVGLLADVASTISKNVANIIDAKTKTRENKSVDSHFTLAVESTEHLERVLTSIKKVKGVLHVTRVVE